MAAATLVVLAPLAAEPPLPALRIEPATGGSIFYIKNTYTQPLVAYMIEMPDYPGSYYVLFSDMPDSEPVAPGAELRKPIANMTVGAVPEYVKMQAAIFADGATSGAAEKVAMLVERRRAVLGAVREAASRLDQGQGTTELKQWSDGLPPIPKNRARSQEAANQAAVRMIISKVLGRLATESRASVLVELRTIERALAESKPAL